MLTVCHCGREEERGQDQLVHDWNVWRDVAVAAGAIVALDTPNAGSAFLDGVNSIWYIYAAAALPGRGSTSYYCSFVSNEMPISELSMLKCEGEQSNQLPMRRKSEFEESCAIIGTDSYTEFLMFNFSNFQISQLKRTPYVRK